MKLFLDTTYLLPSIKIEVEGISASILKELLATPDIELFFADISLFELAAKGTKLIISGESLTMDEIRDGIDVLQNHPRVKSESWTEHPFLLDLALLLRKIHSVFIDCIILASAVCYADCIATFDQKLYETILNNPEIIQEILDVNQQFRFWFNDLSAEPVPL